MQLKKVKGELAEVSNYPQGLLLEAIHSAGYAGALANPLFAPEAALHRLDGSILEDFVSVRTSDLVNSINLFLLCCISFNI